MATIHPSRMGLIPQDMRGPPARGRSPSPRSSRRRSPSPSRGDSGARDRDARPARDSSTDRRRPDSRDRYRDNRDRMQDRDSYRDRDRRRPSPSYDEYRRPAVRDPPPHQRADSGYGERKYQGKGSYGNTSSDFLESRRAQREAMTANVWPSSPTTPARELSPEPKRSSKKSKRHRSPSSSELSTSEDERRQRERKERKRAKRREREERKEKRRRHRSRSRDASPRRGRTPDEESDHERPRKHRRHTASKSRTPERDRHRSKSTSARHLSRSRTPEAMQVDERRLEQPHGSLQPDRQRSSAPPDNQDDSDEDIGPQPMTKKAPGKRVDEREYGGALLRGEGSAMAAFLQDGTEARIPRRGEIGLTSDQIAQFEDAGYVMSGSRHRRMNAVRMRKENQVISAEEKRSILKLQKEEKMRHEALLREEFSELVNEKLKMQGLVLEGSSSSAK